MGGGGGGGVGAFAPHCSLQVTPTVVCTGSDDGSITNARLVTKQDLRMPAAAV